MKTPRRYFAWFLMVAGVVYFILNKNDHASLCFFFAIFNLGLEVAERSKP